MGGGIFVGILRKTVRVEAPRCFRRVWGGPVFVRFRAILLFACEFIRCHGSGPPRTGWAAGKNRKCVDGRSRMLYHDVALSLGSSSLRALGSGNAAGLISHLGRQRFFIPPIGGGQGSIPFSLPSGWFHPPVSVTEATIRSVPPGRISRGPPVNRPPPIKTSSARLNRYQPCG